MGNLRRKKSHNQSRLYRDVTLFFEALSSWLAEQSSRECEPFDMGWLGRVGGFETILSR